MIQHPTNMIPYFQHLYFSLTKGNETGGRTLALEIHIDTLWTWIARYTTVYRWQCPNEWWFLTTDLWYMAYMRCEQFYGYIAHQQKDMGMKTMQSW